MKFVWPFLYLSFRMRQGGRGLLDTPMEQSKQGGRVGQVFTPWLNLMWFSWDGWWLESRKHARWDKNGTLNNIITQRGLNLYWIILVGSIEWTCEYGRWQILVPHLLNYEADLGTSQSLHWTHYSQLCSISALWYWGIRWWDKNIPKW